MLEKRQEIECAPVLIPTCNRVNHLKGLINSLSVNELAINTDVYISVDYPPSKKYEDGYVDVVKFCREFQRRNTFKNVCVYYQQKNLGAIDNGTFLINKVKTKYYAFIFTEDDNIVASNLLTYINNALVKYRDSEEIATVCAHNPMGLEKKDVNVVAHRFFSPYVSAYWVDKYEKIEQWTNSEYLLNYAKKTFRMLNYSRFNPRNFNCFVDGFLLDRTNRTYSYENGEPTPIDIFRSLYLYINCKYAIYPKGNLVFNNGRDGSGVNSKENDPESPEITGEDIDFSIIDNVCFDNNHAVYDHTPNIYLWLRSKKPILNYLLWRYNIISPREEL